MPHIFTEPPGEAHPNAPNVLPHPAAPSQRGSTPPMFANRSRPGWQATRRHPFFLHSPALLLAALHDEMWAGRGLGTRKGRHRWQDRCRPLGMWWRCMYKASRANHLMHGGALGDVEAFLVRPLGGTRRFAEITFAHRLLDGRETCRHKLVDSFDVGAPFFTSVEHREHL